MWYSILHAFRARSHARRLKFYNGVSDFMLGNWDPHVMCQVWSLGIYVSVFYRVKVCDWNTSFHDWSSGLQTYQVMLYACSLRFLTLKSRFPVWRVIFNTNSIKIPYLVCQVPCLETDITTYMELQISCLEDQVPWFTEYMSISDKQL